MINQMEKRIKEERKIMVSKGGVPKGRIIPVYLTDEGDVYPIYLHEILRSQVRETVRPMRRLLRS